MKTNKILYQWDAGQKLTDCRGVFVDFVISGEVYRCDAVNGECIVPDELLQHPGKQTAYECMADSTLQEFVFSVVPRPLPPDYVYTPTEKLTFEGLVQKVDDTVADIIRRADSGEFDGYTPVKGKDYFTESEKNEMMQRVSDGAIGEFREVVDSATAGFNKNSSAKTNDYNTNAEKKVGVYDSNAAEKLKAYNDNHTEKMTAYDANAAGKTAEFDSHASELQTEVNNLKAEGTTLRAEAGKQQRRIDALMKLNKGQTYDILPEEGEAASRTAPSGAKYVSVDKVGGKSVVWNQLWNYGETVKEDGVTFTYENHFYDVVKNTTVNNGIYVLYNVKERNKYYLSFEASSSDNIVLNLSLGQMLSAKLTEKNERYSTVITSDAIIPTPRVAIYLYSSSGVNCSYRVGNINVIDLSAMFGAGNEPTAEQFERMFPADVYPYNPGEIISSRTETITAGAETITTGFPELRSAGTAHDEIDMDGGEIRRSVGVVDLGTLDWTYNSDYKFMTVAVDGKRAGNKNLIISRISRYNLSPNEVWQQDTDGVYGGNEQNNIIYVKDLNYSDPAAFKVAIRGAMLHYERATPTTEPVTIPEPLKEWLPVEPGGTVTFRNADESKQLEVPNAVSWVRKLDEVE